MILAQVIMAEVRWEWVYPDQHGRVYPPDPAIKTSYQGEIVYICKRCDYVYQTRINLNRHLQAGPWHPAPGKYLCRACPKTFRKDYHRRVHETVHSASLNKQFNINEQFKIDKPSRVVFGDNPLNNSISPPVSLIQPIAGTEPLILRPVEGWHDYSQVFQIEYG